MRAVGESGDQTRSSVLIVEDDDETRFVYAKLLEARGYAVATCENGLEALAHLRHQPETDAVLLDLMLPVMDGWRFRIEQRQDPKLSSIPVIALSADDTPKARAIDADAYLGKPVDYQRLVDTLERLVAARKRAQREAQVALADRLTSMGTLAAGIAHEVNNPLAYVMANLDYVLGGRRHERPLDDEEIAALESAREGAERIRTIIRDIQLFAHPGESAVGPVDVRRVIDSCVTLVMPQIRHRAQLERHYETVPDVTAGEAQLAQVFVNLLVNAAQAIPSGEFGRHTIRIVVRAEGARVVCEVQDTGVGVAEEIQGKIFDPFFTTKPLGVGSGLGLAVAHGIVTSLKGTIALDSSAGCTTFRVTLPAADRAAASARKACDPVSTPSARSLQPEPSARRARVLVIDDEPMIGRTMELVLSDEHDVVAMTSGRAACDRLVEGESFDVVFCDLMMPDMSGMDIYAELVEKAPTLLPRVVFLTGGAFTPSAHAFLESTPNQRIHKPFDLSLIRDVIRSRLSS
jgi:signal transduction histidine kinase